MDNKDRAKSHLRYAHKVLEYAKSGGEYYNWEGELVSASACTRQRENTPLTPSEAEYFDLDDEYRDEYLRRILKKIDALIACDVREYSLHNLVGSIRYDSDSNNGDTFKCNDHWTPVVARILSENYDGEFIFHFKGVKGEEIPKSEVEPMIAPFFLKVM